MQYIITGSSIYDNNKDEYEVLESIGSGGFGTVFKLKRKKDVTIFALKTLQVGFSQKEYLDSFRHEGESAMNIRNENVLQYLFFHDGSLFPESPPYIIMEFADEGSLLELLQKQKSKGFFSNEEIKTIFNQLINGMKAINKKVVHRDLKPANILISKGKLKISDFGLSKISEDHTRTSTFKGSGTCMYMSPEAWRLEKNTVLMDIYSMGLIFYEIATLNYPFNEETVQDINGWRNIHLFKNPKNANFLNPKLSPIIVQLIQKMIIKSPSERFRSWDDIEEFLSKDDLPETKNSKKIDELLLKKAEADNKKREELLKKEAHEKEKEEKIKLVELMFNQKIILPLQDFIHELNEKHPNDKIEISKNGFFCEIIFANGKTIIIDCKLIFEEYFNGKIMPKLRDRKIYAWGIIKASSGKGYNFVLAEKKDDPYGEWIILTNTNHATNMKPRKIEPFYFEYNELERELPHINSVHIYNMKDEALNLDKIYDLISEEIVYN